jgi:hypothetical protein
MTELTCRGCGCTDSRACLGGCCWVLMDIGQPTGICSQCAMDLRWHPADLVTVGRPGGKPAVVAHVELVSGCYQEGAAFYFRLHSKHTIAVDAYPELLEHDQDMVGAEAARFAFARDWPEYAYVVMPEGGHG